MAESQGTSTSAVLTTLSANLILFGIFIGGFLLLRMKFKRIYAPKSSFDLVSGDKKPEPLPRDPIRWVFILLTKPHSFIIQQCGLDGYFFLRYIYVMGIIFGMGILTWIVLLPVNAVNGKGNTGLDQLSISNVNEPKRYYAHALMSWVFYGLVMYVIYRELFFFNSFKNAVLASPKYASKLSSRTVLFQSVPDAWLDEKQISKLFNGVKRIYVARNIRKLTGQVTIREQTALNLERTLTKYIKSAVKAKTKAEKKAKKHEISHEEFAAETQSNPIEYYIPREKRPSRRKGLFSSERIDLIDEYKEQLKELDETVHDLQKQYRKNKAKNSLFVEFEDQYTAQLAAHAVLHHNPLRMTPAHIGVEPEDVDWGNMRLFWWERIVRKTLAVSAIGAVTIFWAIPVAFVGVISNITYLTEKLPWLSFINNCPSWLLGTITGLLPTIMLALLLLILPMFIRAMGKVAGCVSAQQVEHFTHKAYFLFLMVNGFLITALASSASATVQAIINDPTSVFSILALNLPRSSNFYISYLILQGMAISSGALFQIVGFFLYYILGGIFDSTLRRKWLRFSVLGSEAWGTTFALYNTLVCITLTFSIVAPMILLFATFAFGLVYITYCHNLTYVLVEGPDSRGSHYPLALFHTFVGIYIGEVCLLGLFLFGKGWGPIVLQAIGICGTIFFHMHLKLAFSKVLPVIPIDCMRPLDGVSKTVSFHGDSDYKKRSKKSNRKVENVFKDPTDEQEKVPVNESTIARTGSFGEYDAPLMAEFNRSTVPKENILTRFFRPDAFLNFALVKKLIPASYMVEETNHLGKHAYDQPFISQQMPSLWIPKDPYGWSAQEIENHLDVIKIYDFNSEITEKGKIAFTGPPPFEIVP